MSEELDRLTAERAQNLNRIEMIKEQAKAILEESLQDEEIVELLRCTAWQQVDRRSVRISGGRVVNAPQGWPDGVTEEEFLVGWSRRFFEENFEKALMTRCQSADSERIEAFRSMLK